MQDIHYAENQLVKALPTMAQKATDPKLKQGFLTHLEETRQHVMRLEQMFKPHGAEIKAIDCPAIDGIIEEADDTAGEVADKNVLDAALINAAQAAEHYEITRYGSLVARAKQLGRSDCASILQKTLDQEKATDRKLTSLAESKTNLHAASQGSMGREGNTARAFAARCSCAPAAIRAALRIPGVTTHAPRAAGYHSLANKRGQLPQSRRADRPSKHSFTMRAAKLRRLPQMHHCRDDYRPGTGVCNVPSPELPRLRT